MGKKLYVGNLSYSVTDGDLNELFGQIGAVESARVIMDRDSGRSKGFGFIEMATDDAAQDCIRELSGRDLQGRQINVSEAKPQEPRTGGGGARRNSGGGARGRY